MAALDWAVVSGYFVAMLAAGLRWWRGGADAEAHFLGGRALPWWALSVSTTATQTSATSFLGIPAYVAVLPGGGLTWLQYELAVPLAVLVVAVMLVPPLRGARIVSVYEYLESRFDPETRRLVSAVFLLSRALATGVALWTAGLVVQACTGLPALASLLLMGAVTVLYDAAGGMRAVVWTDVAQMVVLLTGLGICLWHATALTGGWQPALQEMEAARMHALQWTHGLGDGGAAPVWGFAAGGFVMYVAYYGVDQTQVQRQLSARSVADAQRLVLVSGLLRLPLALAYVGLGVALAGVLAVAPGLRDAMPHGQWDRLVPDFILLFLPPGLRGVVVAAILAAAMSSLDSAINSLAASTVRDFGTVGWIARAGHSPRRLVVAWGAVVTVAAVAAGQIAGSVVETINRIGVVFYGPLLAAFVCGVASPTASGRGVRAGVVAGLAANLCLLLVAGQRIFWMWLSVSGMVVATLVSLLVARGARAPHRSRPPLRLDVSGVAAPRLIWWAIAMTAYTIAMVAGLAVLDRMVPSAAGAAAP